MAANTTLTTRGSRRPDIKWLVRLAQAMRSEDVESVELDGVKLTLRPRPSHAAAMPELDLAPELSPAESREEASDLAYRASALVPVNIRALREKRKAAQG